jgi:hypothetical protein
MEDKKIADDLVAQELEQIVVEGMRGLGIPSQFGFEDQSDWPDGDGERMYVPITIGVRGDLTKHAARKSAATWREVRRRYPKAMLVINLLGFNEDPREIWSIAEAAKFVRWWARYSGMADMDEVERYVTEAANTPFTTFNGQSTAEYNITFLAGCGVYGEEIRAHVLRNQSPIKAN